jgi:hypothetical protein
MKRPVALLSKLALLASVVVCAGCYNPNIATGGFKCSSEFVKDCPDGFKCVNGLCWKGGIVTDASVPDVKTEAAVEAPVDKIPEAPVEKPADAPCAIKPVMSCTPAAGKCDPLCQTGCDGCHQKCSVNTKGTLTCNEPSEPPELQEGDTCEPASTDTDQQTDACAPGLVCVDRSCKNECAKLCRSDADCPGSTCTREYATGFNVCDVKAADCNPVTALGPTRCPGLAQGCYVSAVVPDRTVCDCPFKAVGLGKACKVSRDCLRGLVCVDATGTTDFRCYIACSLTGATSGCSGAQPNCRPIPTNPASMKYGFCRE